MVTIFGYGSLMSYSSVLLTMPSALNFRPATLVDYSRDFNLVSISGIKSGTLGRILVIMHVMSFIEAVNNFRLPSLKLPKNCAF